MVNSAQKYERLSRHFNKFCLLSYLSGIALFVFFNHEDQSEHCYFSENALLPGLVQLNHRIRESQIRNYAEVCSNIQDNGSYSSLQNLLQDIGMEVHEQNFQYKSNFLSQKKSVINGTNIYGIIRAMRSASTESIIVNIPLVENQVNYASGVSVAFGELARNELFWAKDIIILFTEHGSHGLRAWLDVYHGMSSSYMTADRLTARAGSIQAAVILELNKKEVSYINLKLEGRNGQLPNLDLVNLAVRLSKIGQIPTAINHHFAPHKRSQFQNLKKYLKSSLSMMKQLATGKSSGNHGEFLIYNVPAITMEGIFDYHRSSSKLVDIEKLLNGICRSLNNLLERFHQSFFFYFLPSNQRYISISMFMPCFGLVLIPAVAKALILILAFKKESESSEQKNKTEPEEKDPNQELEQLLTETGSQFADSIQDSDVTESSPVWYEVMVVVAGTYLTGLMLFYSPRFTTVWSEMYQIPLHLCFVLLQIFVCLLGMGFVSSLNISMKASKVLRIVTLFQLSIVLGTLAITNFSLGYVASIFTVPPALLVSTSKGSFRLFNKLLVLLASPVVACLLLFETIDDFIGLYRWYVTDQSMLYVVFTCLFFPLWLQLWGITTGVPQHSLLPETKEKKD